MPGPATAVADNAAAAEREAGERERAQPQGGGFFSRKYGPLKGWQWSLTAGGLALAYFWRRSRKKAQATGTSTTGTGTGYAGQIAGLQDEIDQLQGGSSISATSTTGGSGGGGSGGGGGGTGTSTTGTSGGGGGGGGGHSISPPTSPHMDRVGVYAARAAWGPPSAGSGRGLSIQITGYEVVRSGAGVNTTTGTSHSFVGLKPGTHYTWKVRAISPHGKSAWVGGSFTTEHSKRQVNPGGPDKKKK